ncbi:MAG: response regulator [Candidatus Delongbacteria bacterium]|nr:response regulator [Candidatus Delongbacteria bacterium]
MSTSKKILIVDDEQSTCEVLSGMVDALGYQSLVAENGVKALEIFKAENPDLVISDIKMPEMDGMELLHELREISNRVKIIILTGYPSADTIVETIENEGFTYLVKPVKLTSLEAVLLRAFQ